MKNTSDKSYFLTLLGFCIILQTNFAKKTQEKEIKNGEETTCHTWMETTWCQMITHCM